MNAGILEYGIVGQFLAKMGLGELITDPSISELIVCNFGRVFVDREGRLQEVQLDKPISEKQIYAAVNVIASAVEDTISPEKPELDARLQDGSRVAALLSPVSANGISLTIRKFARLFSSMDLVDMGALPPEVLAAIIKAIDDKHNVLVSGGTSSGKTTMLNAFIQHIPEDERLVVIEKPMELKITHSCVTRCEARKANGDLPEVTVSQLLANSLRQRPDRIIIGEVRDQTGYDMVQAMNTGHSGTFSTIHADGAEQALYRLSNLVMKGGMPEASLARQEVAYNIKYVVHVGRDRDGRRGVQELIKVRDYDESTRRFRKKTLYKRPIQGRVN